MTAATPTNNYKIVLIRIDQSFIYAKYLSLFPQEIQVNINNYFHHRDKVTAFTSALLKYYYLPAMLNKRPTDLDIKINSYGKPYIHNCPEVNFNISHCGEYVILAVSWAKKIGVDIELIDKNIDLTIKSIIFSDTEASLIKNYTDFFVLWTKMEAYLKCLGFGFARQVENLGLNVELSQTLENCQIETIRFKDNFFLSVCISN